MLNKIKTNDEYRAEGFKENELGAIRMFDRLHNKMQTKGLTDKELNRYEIIANTLKL